MSKPVRARGFTLLEAIIVIVITGIVFSIVAVFIKGAIDSYFATLRRAALSEEADAALRFIGRDLQAALPNSVTCTANTLRFLSVRSGGRYREYPTIAGAGTPMVFGSPVTGFDVIGDNAVSTMQDARGNAVSGNVVIGNLNFGAGVCNAASSPGDNIAALTAMAGTSVSFANTSFPPACNLATAAATDNPDTAGINEENDREFGRFYVVAPQAVEYACNSGLTRDSVPLAPHATGASACFACEATNARVQTITVNLTLTIPLTDGDESINMLRQFHVVNLP